MAYWRDINILHNHGDEYGYSLEFELVGKAVHVTASGRDGLDQPYEASDIYIGISQFDSMNLTPCDDAAASGYEQYFVADMETNLGYVINPWDAQKLNENGEVVLEPLGSEFAADVQELIDKYLKELKGE